MLATQLAARFKQEAQAAAGLSSPISLASTIGGKDGDTYYIVMEYLRGTDLKSGIKSHGALDPKKVAQIGSQISSALGRPQARDHPPRHRRRTSWCCPTATSRSWTLASRAPRTATSRKTTTTCWEPPITSAPSRPAVRPPAPLLGVVMYECATGRVPFDLVTTLISVALKQVNELPIPPSQINSGVDADLERIILKCMESDPANRFQTADELRQVLNSYLSGRAVNGGSPRASVPPGELGATKTRELSRSDARHGASRLGRERQNTARSSVSLPPAPTRSKSPSPTKTKIIAAVVAAVAVIGIVVAFATGLWRRTGHRARRGRWVRDQQDCRRADQGGRP